MRIFVLAAKYESRVSRKSQLRDHPTFCLILFSKFRNAIGWKPPLIHTGHQYWRDTPEPELVSWIVIFMYIWDKITNIYKKGMRKRTKWKVMSSEMDPAEFRFMR